MSSGIPNVSTIFRDLSHLSSQLKPTNNSYSLESDPYSMASQQKSSLEQMYSYKQKRHNQLMSRLQKSYEENRALLSSGGEETHGKMMQTLFHNKASTPKYSNTDHGGMGERSWENKRGSEFVMPKMKYRHIEDQKKKDEPSILEQEFYEDGNKDNRSPAKNTHTILSAYKSEGFSQTRQQNTNRCMGDASQSQASKAAQYEDKLESYYNLCRRNISRKDGSQMQEKSVREEKFMRSGGTNRKPMRVEEAVKILSME